MSEANEEIRENDIRIVNLPVKAVFKWSDTLFLEYDERMNPVYYSGWVMHVMEQKFSQMENQKIESLFYASTSPL